MTGEVVRVDLYGSNFGIYSFQCADNNNGRLAMPYENVNDKDIVTKELVCNTEPLLTRDLEELMYSLITYIFNQYSQETLLDEVAVETNSDIDVIWNGLLGNYEY